MKIKTKYIKHNKSLVLRKCKVCGRKFFAYNKGKIVCSDECRRIDNTRVQKAKLARIKNDPQALYVHRKSTIEKREAERKARIRRDLPAIKKALAKGDECLIGFLFNNYGVTSKKRQYRKD